MNRIIIDKENIIEDKITKNIELIKVSNEKVIVNVLKSSDLEIEYLFDNNNIDIEFNISSNVDFNLFEFKKGNKGNTNYTYNLSEYSNVFINKFEYINCNKEFIITNLNGYKAKFEYNFKSISTNSEEYDMVVRHNYKDTISEIRNNSVCLDNGKVSFQVSGYVDNGIKDCIINQNNHIINLTNNKCEIKPNLYINEYDTTANHSALIGGFDNNELFYMQSRGISLIEAKKLLIKGFLLSNMSNKKMIKIINDIIKEYWR